MERINDALYQVTRVLAELEEGFGKRPTASRESLGRLESALQEGRQKEEKETTFAMVADDQKEEVVMRHPKRSFEELRAAALVCRKCPHLVKFRTQVVFGVGNPNADLMFVGEAPGADEDLQGAPFVGRAGQLLTKIVETMGIKRADIYIANIVKCRPDMPPGVSGNRKPTIEEMNTCIPWLAEQIEYISPKVMVALGATAAEGLLGEKAPMRELRGRWFSYSNIPVIVTYHPAYLLRNQAVSEKRKVWEDMLLVMERMEMAISEKQRQFFLPAQ